jgi:hypothetical protein
MSLHITRGSRPWLLTSAALRLRNRQRQTTLPSPNGAPANSLGRKPQERMSPYPLRAPRGRNSPGATPTEGPPPWACECSLPSRNAAIVNSLGRKPQERMPPHPSQAPTGRHSPSRCVQRHDHGRSAGPAPARLPPAAKRRSSIAWGVSPRRGCPRIHPKPQRGDTPPGRRIRHQADENRWPGHPHASPQPQRGDH